MLRATSSLFIVVVLLSTLVSLLGLFASANANANAKQATATSATVDDCNAFPWKDKSKAPALLPGMSLGPSQSIESSQARLVLQTSGDLQLIRKKTNKILWQTNTQGATRATFEYGNLFLQDATGSKIWTTNVTNATATSILQIQHDCNMVIYGQAAFTGAAWASNTAVCIVAHIVPHSHDDVGWDLTPERYYDGCHSPNGGVQGIISTSLQCLTENPNRTYTQVESYFFQRWWVRQNSSTQAMVKRLVENGQLDFTNGGWSMHDEACVHQESAIANMEVGANFLKSLFGDALKLKIGWHIDPFGHASTTPRIMAQMGFDAFFFWRQDNQQRQYDMDRKGFETMWRSSSTLDGSYNMFTSILYNSYCQGCGPGSLDTTCPGAFCCMTCEVMEEEQAAIDERNAHGFKQHDSFGEYQAHTHPEVTKIHTHKKKLEARRQQMMKERTPNLQAQQQHVDRASLLDMFAEHFMNPEYAKQRTDMKNVYKLLGLNPNKNAAVSDRNGQVQNTYSMDYLADEYANLIRGYAGGFRTNNVLIPWGCDFRHNFAYEDYPLMDSIIDTINSNYEKYGMELIYSSPRKYVNAVSELDNDVWPSNNYDYFVYADSNHSYWSGYFVSRAEFKGYERWLMANHRAAETVYALNMTTTPFPTAFEALYEYRQAMGVAQHHDAITGTERTHVRNQYQYILDKAYQGAQQIFQNDIKEQVGIEVNACPLANLSVCAETSALAQGQPVEIVLWNNIMQTRSDVITIPIPVKNVHIVEIGTGTPLQSQVVDTWRLTTTIDVTSPQTAPAHNYQVYVAIEMNPQSYKTIRIIPSDSADNYVPTTNKFVSSIQNEYYKLSFDSATNTVSGVSNLNSGISSGLNQMIAHYCPHNNDYTDGSPQASGAYIFRTCQPSEDPQNYVNASASTPTQWVLGPLCMEVRQVISTGSNMQQAWRLCKGFDYVELTNGLGELETGNNGVEVIQRFSVDGLVSDQTWYTDSEALELQPRKLNKRPNYPYTVHEPIASNFFPCNAFAVLNESEANPNNSNNNKGLNIGVVMDRSRAISSLHDGQLEMLIHRRLIYNDGRGVGQALDARTRVLSTSRLIFHEPKDAFMEKVRLHSLRHTHYPVWFAATSAGRALSSAVVRPLHRQPPKPVAPAGSMLRGVPETNLLPAAIHRHALTYLWDQSLIVRVQHMFDRSEGPLSVPVSVKLQNILPPNIAFSPQQYDIVETDILGVNALAKMGRKAFNTCQKDGKTVFTNPAQQDFINGSPKDVTGTIVLRPMEIRTFVVSKKNQQ